MRKKYLGKGKILAATSVSRVKEFVESYPSFYKFLEERTQDKRSLKRICKIFEEILDAEGKEESIKLSQTRTERYLRQARRELEELGDALGITMPLG